MNIVVRYGVEQLDLSIDREDERVIGAWAGPSHAAGFDFASFAAALAEPREFPPLSMAVVPGDRVAVALDVPSAAALPIVEELARLFVAADVAEFTVVSNASPPADLPAGVTWKVHDPDNRSEIAYLATTSSGQRIYLNKALTDADFVLPIGSLGPDRTLGYRGPWSTLYPGLSERETISRFRGMGAPDLSTLPESLPPALAESSEVGWLIGCQLQVGIAGGDNGPMVAGLESLVRTEGIRLVDCEWTFRASDRADVVVVGVGDPGPYATIDDLAVALESATRLVRRGGKIVALAHIDGPIGPALKRLAGIENPQAALNRLRGHEADPDYLAAKQIATSLAWADVYLHSRLDADLVEDLSIIPLNRPEEAGKLARAAASLIVVHQAVRTRCIVEADV